MKGLLMLWFVLAALVWASAQDSFVRDEGVCGQDDPEVKALCVQVQVQRSKIAELEARLYGHIRAEKQGEIRPRR